MRDEREELLELAERVVRMARENADVAEASVGSSWDLSARVRLGRPELVEEAGQRGVSLRVLRDGRLGVSSTSDLSEAGLRQLVAHAVELAELCEADPMMGPAEPELLSAPPHPELDLYDDSVAGIDAGDALERATRAEAAALAADARLTLSEGATFARSSSTRSMVLSGGFASATRGSYASLYVVPVAEDEGGKKRRGHYWTARRHLAELEAAEAVGREAARRTLAKLGARKVQTGVAPVLFDADAARSLVSTFAGTLLGGALWRKASYLLGRLDTEVASPLLTIVDDPLLPRGPGSRPFDGEGLRSRRNVVVERGRLTSYLLDCYSARKLGLEPTASASRGGGTISATTSNFYVEAGSLSREQLLETTGRGLLVTEMMGFGFNAVTGDFSRGAAGFWIEDGRIAFPVSEVTISSNLDAMLKSVDALGSDLEFQSAVASPSLRVASMTISGT